MILNYINPNDIEGVGRALVQGGKQVDVGEWHAMDVRGRKELVSYELPNVIFQIGVEDGVESWQDAVFGEAMGDDEWAEEQFLERVSGKPLNPPPSAKRWHHETEKHLTAPGGKFTHTYPERFWPKWGYDMDGKSAFEEMKTSRSVAWEPMRGLRYEYGDLDDVVNLLARSPYTRQATFPIFFPEDTGAVHGGRIPCTLHYHFMMRDGKLHMWYAIRSCDFVRHFKDDVYMAGRLLQWVLDELRAKQRENRKGQTFYEGDGKFWWDTVKSGNLTMHIYSLHYFEGDRARMEREYGQNQ